MVTRAELSPEILTKHSFYTPAVIENSCAVDNRLEDKSHQAWYVDYSSMHKQYRIDYNCHARLPNIPAQELLPADFADAVNTDSAEARHYAQDAYLGFLGHVKDNKYIHKEIYTDREFLPSTTYSLFVDEETLNPVDDRFSGTFVRMSKKLTYDDVKTPEAYDRPTAELYIVRAAITQQIAQKHPGRLKKSSVLNFLEIGNHITQQIQSKVSAFAIEKDIGCIHRRRTESKEKYNRYEFICTADARETADKNPHPLYVEMTRTKGDICAINAFIFGHYLHNNGGKPFTHDTTAALAEMTQRNYAMRMQAPCPTGVH